MNAADLIVGLAQAFLDEETARGELREAQRHQAQLLCSLRSLGVPATIVAHRLAAERGLVLPLTDRIRLAERLRKRAWRGTRRPAEVAASHGQPPPEAANSDRAITPETKESNMPKLIKRIVTEEYLEEPDEDDQDEESDDENEEIDQEEDATPARHRHRR